MAVDNFTLNGLRKCSHQEGEILLVGLPNMLLARCKCGSCQKIPISSARKHFAVYCACGSQARLSKAFMNLWTRVLLSSEIKRMDGG